MNIGFSIVSHNSEEDIFKNHIGYPKVIGDNNYFISVVDNVGNKSLSQFCKEQGYFYHRNDDYLGYGGNNNRNFEYLKQNNLDIFIVLNPDTSFDIEALNAFVNRKNETDFGICGAKVIEHGSFKKTSHNRKFPCLLDPFLSLLLKEKRFLLNPDKCMLTDWVGGSFMMFRAELFEQLNGFDEYFFMYYEDADICARAKKKGAKVYYDSSFEFHHDAKREGHKLFSNHFFWNLTSMLKFFLRHPQPCLIGKNKY
jgi:hypothetical protein